MKKPTLNSKLLILIIFFLIVNNANYLSSYIKAQESGQFYYPGTVINWTDYGVYTSMIEQGKNGHLFTKNLHDSSSSKNSLFSPHWYIVGQFSKFTNISNLWSFHIFRIIMSLIFILFLYWWLKLIFKEEKYRLLTVGIIIFANGISPLLPTQALFDIQSINYGMPEAISFATLNSNPLFILSQLSIIAILTLFIKSITKQSYIYWAFLLNIFLILIHPYDIIAINFIITVFALLKFVVTKNKKYIIHSFYIYFSSLLTALYYWHLLNTDENLYKWSQQNITISGHIMGYVFGLGMLSILFVLGIKEIIKRKLFKNDYLLILIIWAIMGWFLVYLPLNFNRRLSNGWQIPLAILSSFYIITILKNQRYKKKYSKYIIAGALIFFTVINSFIIMAEKSVTTFDSANPYLYFGKEKLSLYQEIKNKVTDKDTVLAMGIDGNILPAMTGKKTYIGHQHNTWQFDEKIDKMYYLIVKKEGNFYQWLLENKISYILASEKQTRGFEYFRWIAKEKYIDPLYDNDEFILYKVKQNEI